MFSVYLVYKLKLDFTCLCLYITNQTVESHIEVVVRSKKGDGKPETGVLSASDRVRKYYHSRQPQPQIGANISQSHPVVTSEATSALINLCENSGYGYRLTLSLRPGYVLT